MAGEEKKEEKKEAKDERRVKATIAIQLDVLTAVKSLDFEIKKRLGDSYPKDSQELLLSIMMISGLFEGDSTKEWAAAASWKRCLTAIASDAELDLVITTQPSNISPAIVKQYLESIIGLDSALIDKKITIVPTVSQRDAYVMRVGNQKNGIDDAESVMFPKTHYMNNLDYVKQPALIEGLTTHCLALKTPTFKQLLACKSMLWNKQYGQFGSFFKEKEVCMGAARKTLRNRLAAHWGKIMGFEECKKTVDIVLDEIQNSCTKAAANHKGSSDPAAREYFTTFRRK